MGEVYKATDTRLDRTVAIKILPQRVGADPEVRQRFEREAKTLAALSHPHICPIYDVGKHDGIDFLVMEYLEGETLADRLAKGALPLDLALRFATEVAGALDKAHRQGIVHRDLKPGNVMLTKSGTKLLDFGLAKLQPAQAITGVSIAATVSQPLTGAGTLLGTLHYMSPEQLEGNDADHRSDIFSFGAVIYEMVTGKKAFEGKSAASVIAAVLEREPPAIRAQQPLTPSALEHVVVHCLMKDPDERWQSAGDLKQELKWIASNAAAPSSSSSPADRRRLTVERLMWTAAVMVVAGITAGLAIWVRPLAAPAEEMRLEIMTPPTTEPSSFALSPDGRMMVYAAGSQGRSRLFLRLFSDGTVRPLDGTDGARNPFWSPDNLSIGFFAEARLKILDIAGRSVTTLANVADGNGGSWSRDGVILYAPTGVNALSRVSRTGGTPQAATQLLPRQRSHTFPQFLPDGRHFVFYAAGPADTRGVYVGELDSAGIRRVLDADSLGAFVAPDQLFFARQDTLFAQRFDVERLEVSGVPEIITEQIAGPRRAAVSASDAGTIAYRASGGAVERRHIWFDRTGKEVGAVGDASLGGNTPTLSPDQKRLAIPRLVDGNTDVWILDIARDIIERFTSHPALDSHPTWSPDGTRIVFQRFGDGRGDLYLKPVNGTGDEQLVLSNPAGKIPTDWSSNGEFILYKEGAGPGLRQGWDIFALRIDGDREPIPIVQTPGDDREGQFSPDGKWVAYQSDETGTSEIYVQPFLRPGKRERISPGGGFQVRWRSDGKELFYLTPDGRLMSVPIAPDPADGSLQAKAPAPLFLTHVVGVDLTIARQQYTPSLDGRRFLIHSITSEAASPPITLILNRRARGTISTK